MTTSTREEILSAIASKISGVAGGRIYRTRREQIKTLPVVLVEQAGMSSRENVLGVTDHELNVSVAVLGSGDMPDSAVDATLISVHTALTADRTLGLGNDVQLLPDWETEAPDIDAYDYARVAHRYTVTYRTATGAF